MFKKRILVVLLILLTTVFYTCQEPFSYDETLAGKDIMSLPPMKDQFAEYFDIGNIMNPGDTAANGTSITNGRLTRHFNVLTAENNMKPNSMVSNTDPNSYNFSTADRMVDSALASGIKVVGHTLLWHSQIPQWQRNLAAASKETALAAMKKYVTDVVTHFKGRVYAWDVLNEAFPDGNAGSNWRTAMRTGQQGNPWFMSIGADFVYEGFLAARLADPDAVLYYNDYNTNQIGRATLIRNMVRDVNNQYKNTFPDAEHSRNGARNLIEGIGMQEHHNTDVQAGEVRNTINLFRQIGVILSVSELDVLAMGWSTFSSGGGSGAYRTPYAGGNLSAQARSYSNFFRVYLDNADIIERVTFWGVTDNQSWRSGGQPLLFDGNGRSKPAYAAVIGSLTD